MARKAKVEAVKGVAKAEVPDQPKTTVVAGDMDDLMAGIYSAWALLLIFVCLGVLGIC